LIKKSSLEKKYLEYLNDEKIKIISFDIFETIAFRKVAKAVDIFKIVGNKEFVKKYFYDSSIFLNYRISAEKNARINKRNSQDVSLEEIYSYLPIDKRIQEKILKLEIDEEIKQIYINKQMDEWIKLAKKYNKKVFLISDMYLSKSNIHKIVVDKLKSKNLIDEIFVSSEEKVTKYTSDLFVKIKEKYSFEYKEQLHIGDNIRSDYKTPISLGINCIFYNLEKEKQDSFEVDYKYMNNSLPKNNNLRILSALQNPCKNEEENFYFNLGATIYGPLLFEFVYWLDNVCKKNGIKQIAFLMREGRIFKKFFDKLNKSNIDTKLIYASRASTYISSLDVQEFLEKGINFYRFRLYKIEDFYKSFKLEIKCKVVEKYKILTCREAEETVVNGKNILLYISEDFSLQIKNVEKIINDEKKLVIDYIKSLGIKKESMIVDFGGGGSIIKNITSLDKDLFKLSALFYMHSSGYEVLPSIRQLSFLNFDKSSEKYIELIRRSPEFSENLFNGYEQSTNTYARKDSEINPIFSNKNKIDRKIIESFDAGIESYIDIAKKYKYKKIFSNNELLQLIARLIEVPTEDEVKYLGNLDFEVGAGSSGFFKLSEGGIEVNSLKDYYISYLNNINMDRDKFPWLNGLITKKNPKLIKRIKGFDEFNEKGAGINQILEYLETLNTNEIIIYGAGAFLETLYPYLDIFNFDIPFLIDARANNGEYTFYEKKVKTLEKSEIKDNSTIVIASGAFLKEIIRNIENYTKQRNIHVSVVSILGIQRF
jgi:FMN phosphatase YigB (HAD superfamily)